MGWRRVAATAGPGLLTVALLLLSWRSALTEHDCEMSYCIPTYFQVHMNHSVAPAAATTPPPLRIDAGDASSRFAHKYKLYRYVERYGHYSAQLSSFPVLFVPGHAASYQQVRSVAAALVQEAESRDLTPPDVFSVHFNEEASGLFGQAVWEQAEFLNDALITIAGMYKELNSDPNAALPPLVIVGHSVGGFVARAAPLLPNHPHNFIKAIVALVTPQSRPCVRLDPAMQKVYHTVNEFWRLGAVATRAYSETLAARVQQHRVQDGLSSPAAAAAAAATAADSVEEHEEDTESTEAADNAAAGASTVEVEVDVGGDASAGEDPESATSPSSTPTTDAATTDSSRTPTPSSTLARVRLTPQQRQIGRVVRDISLLSIGVGRRDVQVNEEWTQLNDLAPFPETSWASTTTMRRVNLSTDHLAATWCRQLMQAVASGVMDFVGLCHDGRSNANETVCTPEEAALALFVGVGAAVPGTPAADAASEDAREHTFPLSDFVWLPHEVLPLAVPSMFLTVLLLVACRMLEPGGAPQHPLDSVVHLLAPWEHLPVLLTPLYLLRTPFLALLSAYQEAVQEAMRTAGRRYHVPSQRAADPVAVTQQIVRAALLSACSLVLLFFALRAAAGAEWMPGALVWLATSATSVLSWLWSTTAAVPASLFLVPAPPSVAAIALAYPVALALLAVLAVSVFYLSVAAGHIRRRTPSCCRWPKHSRRPSRYIAVAVFFVLSIVLCVVAFWKYGDHQKLAPVFVAMRHVVGLRVLASNVTALVVALAFGRAALFVLWPGATPHGHCVSASRLVVLGFVFVWALANLDLLRRLAMVITDRHAQRAVGVRELVTTLPLAYFVFRQPSGAPLVPRRFIGQPATSAVAWARRWATLNGLRVLVFGASPALVAGGVAGHSSAPAPRSHERGTPDHAACSMCAHEDGGPNAVFEDTDEDQYQVVSGGVVVGSTFRVIACNCPAVFDSAVDYCEFCACQCKACGGESHTLPQAAFSSRVAAGYGQDGSRAVQYAARGWTRWLGLFYVRLTAMFVAHYAPFVLAMAAAWTAIYAWPSMWLLPSLLPVMTLALALAQWGG